MSILFERILPLVSILLAICLLLILLAVSTSPAGEIFRAVDVKGQYLGEAAVVLDQQLSQAAGTTDAKRVEAIRDLAASLPQNVEEILTHLTDLHTPAGWLQQTRVVAINAFNAIDNEAPLADPDRHQGQLAELASATTRISGHMDTYLTSRTVFETGHHRFGQQFRALVQQLRDTGRDELADQMFRAGNQIQAYAASGETVRLAQMEAVSTRLRIAVASLSELERDGGAELLDSAASLGDARQAMNRSLAQMDLAGLTTGIMAFREGITEERVRTLSMISDARVLLNLYTVFLLVMLGYLGLRLRGSYAALNRSHDQLEERVRERTSDLELAYDELKESQVQLVQAEKMSSLGQLVAGVMHEINTPLLYALNNTAVTTDVIAEVNGYVQATTPLLDAKCTEEVKAALQTLLKQRDEFDVEAIRESAQEVASLNQDTVDGLHQISELVQSLKDFSRLDRATEDRFNVCEGIEKTLTITKNLLKYGIEVEKDFEDVDDIFCSPARINQIFVNLVTNAAQAMDGEGKLKITVRQSDQEVEVRFEDTGCGIEEENLAKITDPFFTTKPVGQGTGLGLSIVHQIVQQHRGSLDIQSEVGKGTRIAVRLPKQPYHDETDEEAA